MLVPRLCARGSLVLVLLSVGLNGGCWSDSEAAPSERKQHTVAPAVPAAAPQALSEFDKGAALPPTPQTLYAMGDILQTQGKDEQAQALLERIVRAYPNFTAAYCDLAELHLRHRRIDDATRTLRAGLSKSAGNPVLLNDLGMCHLLRSDYGSALQAFTQAAARRPDDARYRSNMATALGMMGRYDEALSLYREVITEADAHYNVGLLSRARNDPKRAAAEFRQAQAKEAEDKAAQTVAAMIARTDEHQPDQAPSRRPANAPAGQ